MILNRPSNLWLGALTAVFNVVVLILAAKDIAVPPELVGAANLSFAAIITLIAGQPPIVNVNDSVVVKTNNGDPNKRITFHENGNAITTTIPHQKLEKPDK